MEEEDPPDSDIFVPPVQNVTLSVAPKWGFACLNFAQIQRSHAKFFIGKRYHLRVEGAGKKSYHLTIFYLGGSKKSSKGGRKRRGEEFL